MKEDLNPLSEFVRKDIPGVFNEVNVLRQHETRFLHALNKDVVLSPYEIIIHPSGRCNLQCQWCIGGRVLEEKGYDKDPGRLPDLLTDPENMEKVIRGIVDYKKEGFRVENVSFSGITGEPLIAKKAFIKAVDILKENNIRVGVYTNSVLIDEELIQSLLKIDYINISIDAATPETFAKLKCSGNPRGIHLFNHLIDNIKNLAMARKESRDSKLEINASYVLYPDNYHEIYEAAKLLKEIGVRTLRMKQDISGKNLLSSEQRAETEELFTKIDEIVDDKFRFIKIHQLNNPSEMKRTFDQCLITDLMAAIGSDGNVYPCNYNACAGGIPYGNAIDQSFGEIWEGENRMKIKCHLPAICPTVCDPFKNRSNRLFQAISKCQQEFGSEKTRKYIQEII